MLGRRERTIPLILRMQCLFGGSFNTVAWIVTGFLSLFLWGFLPTADLHDLLSFNESLKTSIGKVVELKKTPYSENKRPVVGYNYKFEFGGRPYDGLSYSSVKNFKVGDEVRVEFSDPHYSRIEETTLGIFSPKILFILIFPIISLALLIGGIRSGIRSARLLSCGIVTTARVIGKRPTGSQIGNKPVYDFEFEYNTREGKKVRARLKSHLSRLIGDQDDEQILYDPEDPSKIILMDLLPAQVQFSSMGDIISSSATPTCMIIPGLAVVGNLICLVYRFK